MADPHIPPELIEAAASGKTADVQALGAALRADGGVEASVLVELLARQERGVRLAALHGSVGRTDGEILHAVVRLGRDLRFKVRKALAAVLLDEPGWEVPGALEVLLTDERWEVRRAAVRAAMVRPSMVLDAVDLLLGDPVWQVREQVAKDLGRLEPPRHAVKLLGAIAHDDDVDVSRAAASSLERYLSDNDAFPSDPGTLGVPALQRARRRLEKLGSHRFPLLVGHLDVQVRETVDVDALRRFGTDLSAAALAGRLSRAHNVDEACDALRTLLDSAGSRSAVLLGDSGTGKTAIVHELVHRLVREPQPWRVLRVSPAEMLAGTVYVGEWQTKVRDLVEAVRAPRKVLLVVPNLQELSEAGATSKSEMNIASMLAPHLESGAVALVGEATPEAYQAGLGGTPSLRRLFTEVRVREAGPEVTSKILRDVADETGLEVADPVLQRITELAELYVSATAQPGRSVGLLRRVVDRICGERRVVSARDVLSTLSAQTGVPVDFLDDQVPLDLAAVRDFFTSRVMGQTRAVNAVVDLVTLVKAGLTDPSKPLGVQFFVGPTGVGKTELARALAEMLFGDASRLVRLDMSEFAGYDSYERLLGRSGRPGLLTGAVRDQPFCVLLLDEIEKAHGNVFDLCLQIFDAGRLTDESGRTADFRKCIVVLTSNVGAREAMATPVGFGGDARPTDVEDETVLTELRRFFRPEFLNRLDRIVTFQPLGADTAEKIARREVLRVVERGGLTRRQLVVDVDPAAIALLLRRGYSPAFGARHLKRTVERMVLLPMARTIATGKTPEGSVLRLVARGRDVAVEVIPPDPGGHEVRVTEEVGVHVLRARAARLASNVARLRDELAAPQARKTALLAQQNEAGFWSDKRRAASTLEGIRRLDGIIDLFRKLETGSAAATDRARTLSHGRGVPPALRDLVARLEREVGHVEFLASCKDSRDLGDAFVVITSVSAVGQPLDGVVRLAGMYDGFCKRRGMEFEVIDDCLGGEPPADCISAIVTGTGAYALLSGDDGHHHFSRTWVEPGPGSRKREDRDVVRVEILPVPGGAAAESRDDVTVETAPLSGRSGRMAMTPDLRLDLLHTPSMTAVHAWTTGPGEEAVTRFLPLLHARVARGAGAGETSGLSPVVRRYSLGPSPLVRDRRTGRSSGRLERVLGGELDLLLPKPVRV